MGKKDTTLCEIAGARDPIFQGVEHVGLCPTNHVTGKKLAEWYAETFEMNKAEGKSNIFLNSTKNPGRIEVLREPSDKVKCHIAIRVSNFEEACRILKEKDIELEEPRKVDLSIAKKGTKLVYLKKPDPAGNRIHLIFMP